MYGFLKSWHQPQSHQKLKVVRSLIGPSVWARAQTPGANSSKLQPRLNQVTCVRRDLSRFANILTRQQREGSQPHFSYSTHSNTAAMDDLYDEYVILQSNLATRRGICANRQSGLVTSLAKQKNQKMILNMALMRAHMSTTRNTPRKRRQRQQGRS